MSDMLRIATKGGEVIAPDWAAVAQLSRKLAEMSANIGPMAKDSTNPHFKYAYTSYAAVAATLRWALKKYGLAFSVAAFDSVSVGDNRCLLSMEGQFTDTETGASKTVLWYGEGQDSQDKATAKALTSGVKYLLMRNLLVSEEDDADPDADGEAKKKPSKVSDWPLPEQKLFLDDIKSFGLKSDENIKLLEEWGPVAKFSDLPWTGEQAEVAVNLTRYAFAQGMELSDVYKALGGTIGAWVLADKTLDAGKAAVDTYIAEYAKA